MARSDERNGRQRRFYLLTGVEMCPITKGEMPQDRILRRFSLLRVLGGSLGTFALVVFVGFLGLISPQHATASHHVLDVRAACPAHSELLPYVDTGSIARSELAEEPAAAVSGIPHDMEAQHPATPLEAEDAPESGEGSIEAGDDLSDFDDFAYHLRVVFDGTAQLNREVERGVSLGGRAISRLEDDRNHKPPRA
jgi:hypothetical protein